MRRTKRECHTRFLDSVKTYFSQFLITLFSSVAIGIIRPFTSHSLWISTTWCQTVYSRLSFFMLLFIRFIGISTLNLYLHFCITYLKCSDSVYFVNFLPSIFCQRLYHKSSYSLSSVSLFFAYIPYIFLMLLQLLLVYMINSIAGDSLHLSLCFFVPS